MQALTLPTVAVLSVDWVAVDLEGDCAADKSLLYSLVGYARDVPLSHQHLLTYFFTNLSEDQWYLGEGMRMIQPKHVSRMLTGACSESLPRRHRPSRWE